LTGGGNISGLDTSVLRIVPKIEGTIEAGGAVGTVGTVGIVGTGSAESNEVNKEDGRALRINR
jgi:hypothetical protein